ncbi:unnamed protein product [Acanthoscelides obtectus]|uniref:Uncharacterized protein n=1 Tax=Acanthoscelides obtectus TaxID=200917 RepID=A0A9P0JUN4_ACAOB|nr:unnamed protein product [Acanthoscelides obtectus]CAK1621954.1 hypothetical protein AOBTE_LOCUS1230 [Acanthoscelides obtectus]
MERRVPTSRYAGASTAMFAGDYEYYQVCLKSPSGG